MDRGCALLDIDSGLRCHASSVLVGHLALLVVLTFARVEETQGCEGFWGGTLGHSNSSVIEASRSLTLVVFLLSCKQK